MREGDMMCYSMYSGVVIIGKMKIGTESFHIVGNPRVVQLRPSQTKNEMMVDISPLVGTPDEISIPKKDVFLYYKLNDGKLISAYLRVTTGLSLADASGTFN